MLMGLSVAASGQEKKIRKTDLPAAVQKTAAEQGEGATVRGYTTEVEAGRRVYEVELMKDGHSKDVSMSADGKVMEVEEQVEMRQLPPAVRAGIEREGREGQDHQGGVAHQSGDAGGL